MSEQICRKILKHQEGGSFKIPEITVYGKQKYKELLSENDAKKAKFLADISKYKKDSAEWVKANRAYHDSLRSYNYGETSAKLLDNYVGKEYGHTQLGMNEYIKMFDIMSNISDGHKSLNTKIKPIKDIYYNNVYSKNNLITRETTQPENIWLTTNYLYKKPTTKPIQPIPPTNESSTIKYDPKYEDLRMRSLWANIAKQDSTQNIGTLNSLDNNFSKGFTITEASKFPQEIKDKYNLNYIDTNIRKNLIKK